MKKRTGLFAVLALLCTVPAVSRADTIFSSLGGGYSNIHGLSVNDVAPQNFETNIEEANVFTVGAGSGYSLTQIDIPLLDDSGGAFPSFDVKLMTDSGGSPGSVLATWTLNNVPYDGGTYSTIQPSQTISGITGITMNGNTTYWLAAFPHQLGSMGKWMETSTDAFGPGAYSTDGGSTWTTADEFQGAFDILGTPITSGGVPSPVPEPGSLILFSSGAVGLLGLRRRKRLG